MKLDYGTQIGKSPIRLSIGTIRKPTLGVIDDIGFDRFDYYKFMTKLTPEQFHTVLNKDRGGETYWNSISDEKKQKMTMYDIILSDENIARIYVDLFNFFFVETVVFKEEFFVIIKDEDAEDLFARENIIGVISSDTFQEVIEIIQQICLIYDDEEEDEPPPKFKNSLAQKMYEKMKKAKPIKKKSDQNLILPNLISAVCSRHPSINYSNVWELTVFQLVDMFNRMRLNSIYDIDSTRVSVWGDEKKTFDESLWYKNEFDKKEDRS